MAETRSRRIAYLVSTALTALLFAVPAVALLLRVPHFAVEMGRLGYPPYFLTLLGIFKLLGAAVVALPGLPRLKEWAYAGLLFDVVGAVVSRTALGDGPMSLVPPVLIGVLLLLSWWLRPHNRKLVDDTPVPA